MRVTSELFVAAHLRRCMVEGAPAVVVRHGADSAGAIFVIVDHLDGAADLYGPAPQTAFEGTPTERLFQRILAAKPTPEIDERLRREARFDPDLWVIAIEDRAGRCFLDVVA